MTRDYTLVLVPGLRGHVPDHWQTFLAQEIVGSVTVISNQPLVRSRADKVMDLERSLSRIVGKVVLVAHSAGCHTVSHWASLRLPSTGKVVGALLVTPADIERNLPAGYPTQVELLSEGWLPAARKALPFPAVIGVSDNDPLAQAVRVEQMAREWGAAVMRLGAVGHMNPASGFGRWAGARDAIAALLSHCARIQETGHATPAA